MLIACCSYADMGDWDILFGLYSSDSVFTDDWNFAGVDTLADDEWDSRDIQKYFPPVSEYAIIFFPHSNPSEPDYWAWPHNNDYASDIRSPLDSTKTWRMKIRSLYSHSNTLTIWWKDEGKMPGTYLPILIREDGDTMNMRERHQYTAVFPPGLQRWKFTVVPDYYEGISVNPASAIVHVAETRHFRAYLLHDSDSIMANTARWEYHGSGGFVDSNGYFTGSSPGGGFVLADIGGIVDSAEVTVIPGGDFYEISLNTGWNLISLPAVPSSNRVDDIFPDIIPPVYLWDADSQKSRTTDTLCFGRGYFVLSPSPSINEFSGSETDSIVAPIRRGWNMLGGLNETIYYPGDFSVYPPEIIMVPPFIFDEYVYFLVDSVARTRGYWILSATNGELKIITH